MYNAEWEEYIVNFKGGKSATSYHTSNLDDALAIGRAMASSKN